MLHFVLYLFSSSHIVLLCWVIHVRGSIFCVLVSNCLLTYVYEFFIDICLYCVLFEIKIFYFFFTCIFFPHMRLCILFKCFKKYTGWFNWVAVYSCNWWIIVRIDLCFVTNCQRGSLLGSKDLGFYVFRTLICIVGKPWSIQCV